MALVSNKKLSIQITDTSINILIGNKNKIYEAHTIELENGDCRDGNVRDKEKIIKLLNNYLDVYGRDVKDVSFVLRGSDIITRYIEVPILKENALKEAVKFEFRQFIPDIEDYYTNFEIIEKINTQDKKAYKILLVAATREKISVLVEIAEAIDKKLEVIDILSNTLARVLKSSDHIRNDEATGVFYFGSDSSTLSIIEENILKIERNLPFGVKNIFNEAYAEAAATALDGREVSNIFENNSNLSTSFENLLSSVNNTVRYYNSEKGNKPVTNFIIICADMIMDNMEKYLEKYFELPCILIKDPLDLGLRVKFEKNFPKYMPAYGLLLRGNNNKLLNLSPKVATKEKNKSDINKVLVTLPILITVGVLSIGIPFLIMNNVVKKEILAVEADIARYNEIIVKNEELKAENAQMEYFIKRVEDIENSTAKTSIVLSKINTYVPKEIKFMNLSFADTGTINISGESSTYSAIPEFLANLEMSEEFCNAKISYINPIEETIQESVTSNNTSTRISFMPVAMVGGFNIWNNIIIASDAEGNQNSTNNSNESTDANGESSGSNNSSSGNSSNESETSGTIITGYSFSISVEGVSKDGSKATETE